MHYRKHEIETSKYIGAARIRQRRRLTGLETGIFWKATSHGVWERNPPEAGVQCEIGVHFITILCRKFMY